MWYTKERFYIEGRAVVPMEINVDSLGTISWGHIQNNLLFRYGISLFDQQEFREYLVPVMREDSDEKIKERIIHHIEQIESENPTMPSSVMVNGEEKEVFDEKTKLEGMREGCRYTRRLLYRENSYNFGVCHMVKENDWFQITLVDYDDKGIVSPRSGTRSLRFHLSLLQHIGKIPTSWIAGNHNGLTLHQDVQPQAVQPVERYTLDMITGIIVGGIIRFYIDKVLLKYDEHYGTQLHNMVLVDPAFINNPNMHSLQHQ